jgi:hypothetical protein
MCTDKLPEKQLTAFPGNMVNFLIGMVDGIDGKQTLTTIGAIDNSF